ncbi:Coenzyme F420 hydrogenase/dehydrogenase, beta subunit C-terminal domain [Vibrio fluvialis]|nr:Coenzyme F420 hydrogenase/dehydrogenase, beta subunit C-terminal domain [Vibrio fluvialis]MBY7774588.1 Coenzyme F420 hydrogenase/dehydrogenase, beta subunit C-terminal domain [Vibrio fluvialis]MBY7778780.1 Coenzyme F420 hydrogenase/dehydrogenase, beta subunit C-terminal domain [Vibrio fluvialis]MBY7988198.1 Coenzyme F420 hydrogenase/dehydrogenase, beta subunit C-terminal domain [Vibrio fluvialis]MBY7993778.1 Coenzyme F420 hydrogenase/dehydrogenase, beta subunit C-terminal domain [Vibrio fluv
MTIKNVIDNGYCVGCGGCKLHSPDNVTIKFEEDGFYQAKIKRAITPDLDSICPFSDHSVNETQLGNELYGDSSLKHDEKVGYYSNIYAGHVIKDQERINSSSGGLTSWICEKLLINDHIDAVVHVGVDGKKFNYRVSKTVDELRDKKNKKSRYYPVSFNSIEKYLNSTNDRVLVVGIPCYIKTIRLLQRQGKFHNIKYCVSLLCGHMKSSGFGESLAWQLGVRPSEQEIFDFRVKKPGLKASQYYFEVENKKSEKLSALNWTLLGSDWGLTFFRHQSCNFCDDIAGEVADITLGDAWLDKYTQDYLGTNIAVVRNDEIEKLLREYSDEIHLETVDVNTFYETQKGNYGNRRGGIIAQLSINNKKWVPHKRLEICKPYEPNKDKSLIYLYREKLSRLSISRFKVAKKVDSLFLFKALMFPYLMKYYYMNNGYSFFLKKIIPRKFIITVKKLKI